MTEKPRAADPGTPGSAPGGSAPASREEGQSAERVVIRDRRKIDPNGGKGQSAGTTGDASVAGDKQPQSSAEAAPPASGSGKDGADPVQPVDRAAAEAEAEETVSPAADAAGVEPPETPGPGVKTPEGSETPSVDEPAELVDGPGPLDGELATLRAQLDERTRDLQRVTAEYANYRKRVDRDRGVVAEQTTGTVLTALLPVLDDLDRAREHGDLVGPFGSVAEQLTGTLSKFGLSAFGEKGDPFDPNLHEAVAHLTSAEVTESTCVDVMRRGYLLGDRLLRAALVAVADPE